MLTLISKPEEIKGAVGEIRAGGTDLHDRYRLGVSSGPIIDIHKLPYTDITQNADGTTTIGAMVTIDEVGQNPITGEGYGALAKAANGLATPQIRWAASFGGSLLQRTRCWYYRHPQLTCTKKGDAVCGGRDGHHPNGVIFDHGGCAHPHPSTLATALLAYDATVKTTEREMPISGLYGDGSDHSRDHVLHQNEILTHVMLPAPIAGEKTAYFRSISRFEAEWPIVECVVRLVAADGIITAAGIGAGGISQIPMRLSNVEAALLGKPATKNTLEQAVQVAAEGANPLPQAAWKVEMLIGTLLTTLEMTLAG
ncbi:MAG: FAD binding domain-containing protein [Ardenticatenaceae bacterium]|nr:FAD binding domain-containing protein [Ardenticatenaceae bacterium]